MCLFGRSSPNHIIIIIVALETLPFPARPLQSTLKQSGTPNTRNPIEISAKLADTDHISAEEELVEETDAEDQHPGRQSTFSSVQQVFSSLCQVPYLTCQPASLVDSVDFGCVDTTTFSTTMTDSDNHNMPGSSPRRTSAVAWAGQLAHSAGQAVQSLTVRRYALPDKHVASQVLMYRQLLHTKCRPGLTLSREYQGTPAQTAVKDMPWWCLGVEDTRKMVISYDDLLKRLWIGGACKPFMEANLNLTVDDKAPVPHDHWVDRLGFQQTDPVTDFRSGGVLSLAMMVHLVEACPETHARFVRPNGSASVLPFGITSINITDMMARFLMLSKAVDRMDALLSQKPFWRMFADPYSLLVCQEVSMNVTADVVDELMQERGKVTVFDFAEILKIVEQRVELDLLGAGPQSIQELRTLYQRNKIKYEKLLKYRLGKRSSTGSSAPSSGGLPPSFAAQMESKSTSAEPEGTPQVTGEGDSATTGGQSLRKSMWNQATQIRSQATKVAGSATSLAGNVFSKIKAPGFAAVQSTAPSAEPAPAAPDLLSGSPPKAPAAAEEEVSTIIFESPPGSTDPPPPSDPTLVDMAPAAVPPVSGQAVSDDEDWAKVITPATEGVANFSIGDDEEDQDL